jgi:PIN domain nuclease of toxin-antitoxin system
MLNEASELAATNKVLDAYALLALLEGESGAVQVEKLIKRALRNEIRLEMAVLNLGEVYFCAARKKSFAFADNLIYTLLGLPIEYVAVDWDLARQAAWFKTAGGIAFADCLAAALAYQRGFPLVTGDPDFHRLENYIDIEWI